MANVLAANPVRGITVIKSRQPPEGTPVLTFEELRALLASLRASSYCREHDLADPFTILITTGLRHAELLALRWCDYDEGAGTLAVSGKGLVREGDQHRRAPARHRVAKVPHRGRRDPNNFGRTGAECVSSSLPEVATHSFRKSVATLIDDRGLPARIGADLLGHARPSMSQDRYTARGEVHMQVQELWTTP